MRNIAELLNSLNQTPQALGAAQGTRPASSPSSDSSNGQSFGEVVNRLNSQPANVSSNQQESPNNSDESAPSQTATPATSGSSQNSTQGTTQLTVFDQIDIRFTETIQNAANKDQVQQSLAALATAFQQMAGFLLSNPGASADQVQNQIVSATQGAITPDAAKALVAAVQGFLQSLPPSQKSLLADESTRQNLFNQLFQGLAQAASGINPAAGPGGSTTESFDFQMAFGTTSAIQNGPASQTGSQFFEAGVSMDEFNDNQFQTSITNSVFDASPLSGSLADLTGEEGQLLTNLAGTQNTQTGSGVTGQDLANLLSQAQAGAVNLTSFNQSKPTLSADQLKQLAQIDFNQIFNSIAQNLNSNASAQSPNGAVEIPPVANSETLQAPTLGQPTVLGASNQPSIETSILSVPAVVTLQNLPPQNPLSANQTNQAGVINRIFEEISASFNSLTVTAQTAAAVTPAASLQSSAQNQAAGSGLAEQNPLTAPLLAALDSAPQLLNSTPASGNEVQAQDVQTFQNFLRSSVVFDSQKVSFSVDAQNVPNPVSISSSASASVSTSTPTVSNPVPATQGALTPNTIPVSGGPDSTPANAPTLAPVTLTAALAPQGTTVKETVAASELFTNTVVVGENVKPVVAQTVGVQPPQNNNQALPTDPNLSAVQSINPVLAQGVNSVSTVADYSALKDQAFKDQDALSGVPVSPATTADSNNLAGAATFTQTVLANSPSAQNAPINAAAVIQQFAEQISQHTSQNHSVSRISFQLVPESLGRVTIQIALVDQSVSARIVVANPDVKEGLQTHLVDLKAALSQAGLQIDQLQVQIQGGSSNLLGQYYQYQQEGSSYRFPVGSLAGVVSGAENDENTGVLGAFSQRNTLVNLLV